LAEIKPSDPLDLARHCAEAALGMMARHGIPPHPENFSVWYAYVSGRNPELTEAINEILRGGRGFSTEINTVLFERFAAQPSDPTELRELGHRAGETIHRVSAAVQDATAGTARYAATLDVTAAQLDPLPPPEVLAELVAKTLVETRAATETNRRFTRLLMESGQDLVRLRESLEALERDAATDALTQLANRRSFDAALTQAVRQAEYGHRPLCLVMIDVDYFKRFNDRYGHPMGDQVLKLIGRILLENLRPRDTAARYGGEEFALILPDTARDEAAALVEDLRCRVAGRTLTNRRTGQGLGHVTLSAGLAERAGDEDLESLLRRADQALYQAKQAGRNQIVSAS